MILEPGSKVLVVHRRLYENDNPRFFLGVVDAYEEGIAKVRGNTWVRDQFSTDLLKKVDLRTKLVAVASGTQMVYELPAETDMDTARFRMDTDGRLVLADGKELYIDLSEAEHSHKVRLGSH